MGKRDDERAATGTIGAYAIGGAGLAGARLLGGLLSEGPSRSRELGPRPIGSDPWLLNEVQRALAAARDLDTTEVTVEVREAIVTLRGAVDGEDAAGIERAARTVEGIKRLVLALDLR